MGLAVSLLGDWVSKIWSIMVFLSLVNGLAYSFELIGISVSFPVISQVTLGIFMKDVNKNKNSLQGILFALVELSGSIFNFIQIPIVNNMKATNTITAYVLFEGFFYKASLKTSNLLVSGIGAIFVVMLAPVLICISIGREPKVVAKLDNRRRSSVSKPISMNKRKSLTNQSEILLRK